MHFLIVPTVDLSEASAEDAEEGNNRQILSFRCQKGHDLPHSIHPGGLVEVTLPFRWCLAIFVAVAESRSPTGARLERSSRLTIRRTTDSCSLI